MVSSTVVPAVDHVADGLPDLVAAAGIQPGGRLVEEQQARPADQASGDVETPPHPAGVRRHLAVAGLGEAERCQQLVGAGSGAAALDRSWRRPNMTRFSRPNSTSSKRRGLTDQADRGRTAAASRRTSWPATTASPSSQRVSVANVCTAVLLPGPVGTQQGVDGAGRDLEVEAVEGEGVAVSLAQPAGERGVGSVEVMRLLMSYGVRNCRAGSVAFIPYGARRSYDGPCLPTRIPSFACSGGTLSPPRRRRPSAAPTALTVDEVVDAAIEIADRDGLAALAMRSLAEQLGIGVMSLYTYVPSRNDLIALMFDQVLGRTELPTAARRCGSVSS